MSLNELIRFAKIHDIDFDKDIICVEQFNGVIELNSLEQIAMKETDEGNKLVVIPFEYSYNAEMNKNFEFCDTVNSVDLSEKTNVESAITILMKNGKLFFENYKGIVSPITYCNVNDDIITFKE